MVYFGAQIYKHPIFIADFVHIGNLFTVTKFSNSSLHENNTILPVSHFLSFQHRVSSHDLGVDYNPQVRGFAGEEHAQIR